MELIVTSSARVHTFAAYFMLSGKCISLSPGRTPRILFSLSFKQNPTVVFPSVFFPTVNKKNNYKTFAFILFNFKSIKHCHILYLSRHEKKKNFSFHIRSNC